MFEFSLLEMAKPDEEDTFFNHFCEPKYNFTRKLDSGEQYKKMGY